MKHYVSNPHYTTESWHERAQPFRYDGLSTGTSNIMQAKMNVDEIQAKQQEQQDRWKQNIPQGQPFSTNPEGHNLSRTYGTAVDNSQYSTPPVGDYGLVSPQRNPQGVYGPNMYNASARNTEWGRRQF